MAKVDFIPAACRASAFAATAVSIARRHPAVHGWVRNLPDGRVELLVDGSKEAIDSSLDQVPNSDGAVSLKARVCRN